MGQKLTIFMSVNRFEKTFGGTEVKNGVK